MNKLLLIFFLFTGINAFAQENQFSTTADSDPASTTILKKLKVDYEKYSSLEADFSLIIEMPEEDPIVQNGNIRQKDDQYHLKMPGQNIISDGKSLWFHQIDNNLVQLNSIDPDEESEEMFSPQNFMQFYENGKFIVAPITVAKEDNRMVRWIELKPVDTDSEYFKFRISLDVKKDDLLQVKAFGKDGARYTLKIKELTPNQTFDDKIFSFDSADFPGITVEDLRID